MRGPPPKRGSRSTPTKVYVVTAPSPIRGIYRTWPECQAAVSGVRGARYQAVSSRDLAEALLRGGEIRLPTGRYAFVDGNHMGGIGVVFVDQVEAGPRAVEEIGTTVYEVFVGAGLPSLDTRRKITLATDALRNVLAELGGLYAALARSAAGTALTVVHDYEGVGAWMERRWRTKDPVVTEVVEGCRALTAERRLAVAFRHQRGHESTFAGRNDWAAYNARADRLATDAALRG